MSSDVEEVIGTTSSSTNQQDNLTDKELYIRALFLLCKVHSVFVVPGEL